MITVDSVPVVNMSDIRKANRTMAATHFDSLNRSLSASRQAQPAKKKSGRVAQSKKEPTKRRSASGARSAKKVRPQNEESDE
jgi:hypothetical protein